MRSTDQPSLELVALFRSLWQTSQQPLSDFCATYGLDELLLVAPKLDPMKSCQAIKFLPVA